MGTTTRDHATSCRHATARPDRRTRRSRRAGGAAAVVESEAAPKPRERHASGGRRRPRRMRAEFDQNSKWWPRRRPARPGSLGRQRGWCVLRAGLGPRAQRPPACLYCSTTAFGIRPRAGTATLFAPAHSRSCRMSKSRFDLEPLVDAAAGRRLEREGAVRRVEHDGAVLRRAALTYRASDLRNTTAFFLLRSISYVAPSRPNVTVSAASPPSRSSTSFSITSRATRHSLSYVVTNKLRPPTRQSLRPRTLLRAADKSVGWVGRKHQRYRQTLRRSRSRSARSFLHRNFRTRFADRGPRPSVL